MSTSTFTERESGSGGSDDPITIDFRSADEAVATYYGEDSPDAGQGAGDGSGGGWGEMQEEPTEWQAGWALFYQERNQNERRWFVVRYVDGQFQALKMSGEAKDYPETTTPNELPSTSSEDEARSAYQAWVENADEEELDEDGEPEWSEWEKITEIEGWAVYQRDHLEDDRSQFMAGGKNADGENIWLQEGGSVGAEPTLFDTLDELRQAIKAFLERQASGRTQESEEPTGAGPSRSGRGFPTEGSRKPSGARGMVGSAVQAVGGPMNAIIIVVALAALVYYLEREGHIDISGWWDDLTGGGGR